MHGDTYLRGLLRKVIIKGSAWLKTVPTMVVPLSSLSWAGSPGDKIAHHIPLHSSGAPLTSTGGSLTVAPVPVLQPGAPPAITTTGLKLLFFPLEKHKRMPSPSVSQPPFSFLDSCMARWGPVAMKTPLSCFLKEQGWSRASAFPSLLGFSRVEPWRSIQLCPPVSSKTQRPRQSAHRDLSGAASFSQVLQAGLS